ARRRRMIEPVAPAEAVKPPSPLLEEGNDLRQLLIRLHAVARVIAAARIRPARVALFRARAERDDVGAPLRPACALKRNVERKQDFVEGSGHESGLLSRALRSTARSDVMRR